MTLGPGVLFFHKLKCFDVLKQPIISAQEYIEDKIENTNSMTINAFQIVKIPFVQDFFFELSLPTLYLIFFGLFYLRIGNFPEPTTNILVLCFVLLFVSCIKLIKQEKVPNKFISPLFSLAFGCITPLIVFSGKIPFFNGITDKNFTILTLCCLIFSFMFSISPTTNGLNYYEYTHPKLDLLHFSGFRSVLMTLYSTLSTALLLIWHYFDLIFVLITFFAICILDARSCVKIIISGCIIYAILTIFATKRMIQYKVVTLLLPIFQVSKTRENTPKLKVLLRPLGASVFGMMSLPVAQLMLCIALAQSEFLHSSENGTFEVPFFTALLINGEILQATQILVSFASTIGFIHP